MEFWIIQSLNALSFAMLLFLLCAGLSLIFGLMNILNLAHGSCYLIGAYTALSVSTWSESFFLGLFAGSVAAGAVGFVLQRFLLQRIYGRRLLQVSSHIWVHVHHRRCRHYNMGRRPHYS